QCLHVRASEEGDTGANRIRTRLITPLTAGTTATIRAQVRWLCGWPEILFRVKGNYLEATGSLLTTRAFGTPGLPNSRAAPNTGPAIYAVTHSPAVPGATQPVVVTARVHDPDGIRSVVLNYRVDPSTNYVTLPMLDDGTGGDAVAGDGIYSATIPGQGANVLVAFYVTATDDFAPPATTTFPNNPPLRECLVRFGDPVPNSSFGTYRLWLTQKTVTTWSKREVLSHEPLDGTFVYGNSRVVYNVTGRYTGSPYHQEYTSPVGVPCSYTLRMPEDDQVLGTTSFNKLHAPGNSPNDDPTIQTEQTAYWIARQVGLPWNYKRYVALFVNGNRRGPLMEDTQVPDGDGIKENFPDDPDGDLHKLYGWFEFPDLPNSQGQLQPFANNAWATLQNFTTTGGAKKLARYRWNWRPRAVHGSANDFTNLFALVDAANTPATGPYVQNLEAVADTDEWMRTFAVNHSVGNWDSYGNLNGQNMYAYKPPKGHWTMFIWDFNIVLGNSGSNGPTGDDLFQLGDPTVGTMYGTPVFRRNYWRVLKEIVNGPMLATNINPVMDAKYAAFQASGITVTSPRAVQAWIATRRTYILGKLNTVNSTFAITSNNGADFNSPSSLTSLKGSAPVEVTTLAVNGIAYPVTWTSVTNWLINVPLPAITNTLVLQGYDDQGAALTNATASIRVTFTGRLERPQDHVRINEVMYHPLTPDTEFIELYNSSAASAFALSRWRFAELGFTFPDGTVLSPLGFVVAVKDQAAFAAAYGAHIPVAGEFQGLDPRGQTLTLLAPGANGAPDTVINQITYANTAPWPEAADGTGASLQLIDPTQDNSRVANWSAVPTNRTDNRWRFVSATGTASSSRLYLYLTSAGDVYVDDLCLVAGHQPGAGPNLLTNGGFESAWPGPWTVSPNLAQSGISTNIKHSGNASLHLVTTAGGTTRDSAIWEDTVPALVASAPYTLSYWFLPSTNGAALVVRLSGSGIVSSNRITPAPLPALALATPGASNSVHTNLPPFPSLWLNEVQPDNLDGITNSAGARAPWLELFNPDTNAVDLSDCYLADNVANPIQWAFPSGTRLAPGQFLVVWADGRPALSTANQLHTDFTLASATGTVALGQLRGGQPVVLDYLAYQFLQPGRSYGAFPDGQASHRQVFASSTPGAPNDPRFPPVAVTINEWMADNQQTILDPLTGNFDDWFELYNAETNTVDLTDYTLTDDPGNPARFVVPPGAILPPNGFLLVWADNATVTGAAPGDLHVNFKLAKAGSFLGLFAPDGSAVDMVRFGSQTADVSEGRSPDGAPPPFQFMNTATPGASNYAPAPRLVGATLDPNGDVVVVWAAQAGKSCRVQSSDNLAFGAWLDLATNVVSGGTGSFRDSRGAQGTRFYRVIQE
ncbi:MAG: lamin tail domain-containing protein, partial [Verrucomicrobia bacterium]|nr:lamin tail domain-containing protein [Verrucomicrobiota bacterium]